jgi:hypothetical protein
MKNYTINIACVLLLTSSVAFSQQPQRDKSRTPRLSSDDLNRSPDSSKATANPDKQLDSSEPIKVLFVGNSYTYVNNLPQIVEQLSLVANESRPLETKMVAVGGATLQNLWDSGQVVQLLRQERWNYVVLQEQSLLPISNPEVMHKYVRLFDSEITRVGARTILFLTWGRRNRPDTQRRITEAYLAIAREIHAVVAPVGLAWETVRKEYPALSLYDQDDSHPTRLGTYLTACVFYVVFYGKSPEGLNGPVFTTQSGSGAEGDGIRVEPIGKEEARLIQRITWEFLKNRTDEY